MKIKELVFEIQDLSFAETLEYLTKKAQEKGGKTFVVTINPEIIMLARADESYEQILKSADLALNDGVGVSWAAKMFGKSLKGRVHGSDLVDGLSRSIAKQPITVGLLGGRGGVAEQAAKCLKEKYPGLRVAFAMEEPNLSKLTADILFVAFGSPKQEKWIYENLPQLDVRVAIGVGGAFDFISGKVRRAPIWIRKLGLEWLFRLIIQPWRIKRQLSLIKFVLLVFREKILS